MSYQKFLMYPSLRRIFGDYETYKRSLPNRRWERSSHGWVSYSR